MPVARRKATGDSNLIPLINIVFLLLIFFMVAGQIQPQDGSDIQPPLADSADGSTPSIVDVQINRRNEILLDGDPVSISRLQEVLKVDGRAESEQLVVKADKDVRADELGALLDALRTSGVLSIRLITQKSGS
ncbi:Biopolymer transport protein ExbD [Granulosicoccus antarcticus IMCC3135]|uniref:Biopolymer transport protein ExbD n=2 Tax=Granulosicoccus TaxID=437504 RepID=A0A2Z2P5V5_9GAMM|nr:Biopolymer transport protein ExbD [Granulosicoccus antarcticus IMCC3135]